MQTSGCTRRFGTFDLDLRTAELRKQGLLIKLEGQPLQILALLSERPGELVTREEIQRKLWPAGTFVDFDRRLNVAMRKLRVALSDSAEFPRYVETLHRRGYRFLAPVTEFRDEVANNAGSLAPLPLLQEQEFLEKPRAQIAVQQLRPPAPALWRGFVTGAIAIMFLALVGFLLPRVYKSVALGNSTVASRYPGPIANGVYKVINKSSEKALDVTGASLADGALVIQWPFKGAANQEWKFTSLGSSLYQITSMNGGKALEGPASSTTNSTLVYQRAVNGGANQIWQVVPNGDGSFTLLNKSSQLALEVAGSSDAKGAMVIQWAPNGGNNQKWFIQAP
jgi:DNA-binding winged helix-turn-helix (wHTH) protein